MDPLNTTPVITPVTPTPPMPMPEKPKSSIGPIAGAIIVILLLIAGGLYFWGAKLNATNTDTIPYIPSNDTNMEPTPTSGMAPQESSTTGSSAGANVGIPAQSSSDDVASIEADLNAMDFGQIDAANSAEMNNI